MPPFSEALVKICPNNALIQFCAANVLHAVQRILVCVIFDEAEAAGSLLIAIKAHDKALDLAALGEKFVDLFLSGIEGPSSVNYK